MISTALATETTFAGATSTTVATKAETHASAELGGMLAFGNTETMALTGQGAVAHKWGKNAVSGTFGVNWGQTRLDADADGILSDAEREADYVQTAGREFATLRYDRFVTSKDSLYGLAGGFTDEFAGYDWRANAQVGWAHAFVAKKERAFRTELGIDVAREDFVAGIDPAAQTVVSARVLAGGKYAFNGHVSFEDTLEAYENVVDLDDFRVYNTAAITASLSGKLALKLSHQLAYDRVPVEGFQPLDHTTLASVLFTIL